jgi:glycosyltransferase involved in cell wall biosynthesis
VLKGVVPGIERDDKVVLWGGGIWNWFDPLTVIHAVHRLERPDVKLYFLGTRHPNAAVPEMRMATQAADLARDLGLLERRVFFNSDWVPYADRGAYLLEADVGVSAHFDEVESRFAYRTRLLDYVWAGLPIVTTDGDSLAGLVRERRLGRTVAPRDVAAWAEALAAAVDPAERTARASRFEAVRAELAWPRVVDELERLLTVGPATPARRRRRLLAPYAALRVRHAFETRGVAGVARRAVAAHYSLRHDE